MVELTYFQLVVDIFRTENDKLKDALRDEMLENEKLKQQNNNEKLKNDLLKKRLNSMYEEK